jgi:hypothetical protein
MKFAVLALIACLPAAAIAGQADQKEAHSHALGSVDFKNSGNVAAQPAFQRGVALLHSFEYEDAPRHSGKRKRPMHRWRSPTGWKR